jgi:hypothetical protein
VDTGVVKKTPPIPVAPAGPEPGAFVELVDPSTGRPLGAVVETADDELMSIRYRTPSRLRGRTRVRWFDGDDAWEIAAAVIPAATHDGAEVETIGEWEQVAARQSMRVPVDRFPLLVEVVTGDVQRPGRRYDLVCVDVSATGCLATAPGRAPAPGDHVRVAWARGDEFARIAPEWIPAIVTRSETRPFGGGQVAFRFDLQSDLDATRVRRWRDAWAREAALV